MGVAAKLNTALEVDEERRVFRVSRRTFVDPAILETERREIFDKCWLYLGHSSELPQPGDFLTRQVGGRSILFARSGAETFSALLNTCPHRGAQVCREKHGNAKAFQCFYHGWVFGLDGKLRSFPGKDCYPEDFKERPGSSMAPVPRHEHYRGLHFVSFDPDAESLVDYLCAVKEYLDVICDQSTEEMRIVSGSQEYSIRANWKLLTENSIDGYHAATTHATYFDYLKNTTGGLAPIAINGQARALGHGHAVLEYRAPWGAPSRNGFQPGAKTAKRKLRVSGPVWSSASAKRAPPGSPITTETCSCSPIWSSTTSWR